VIVGEGACFAAALVDFKRQKRAALRIDPLFQQPRNLPFQALDFIQLAQPERLAREATGGRRIGCRLDQSKLEHS
jgi:hypothetical protein